MSMHGCISCSQPGCTLGSCPICHPAEHAHSGKFTMGFLNVMAEPLKYHIELEDLMSGLVNLGLAFGRDQATSDDIDDQKSRLTTLIHREVRVAQAKELRLIGTWVSENIDPNTEVPIGSPAEIVLGKVMRHVYERANELEENNG